MGVFTILKTPRWPALGEWRRDTGVLALLSCRNRGESRVGTWVCKRHGPRPGGGVAVTPHCRDRIR
ncbi:hypothetical protein X777_12799 [Ooceraea biroi]|uniref:Uncharacterized protein n=1 Tax=Ooceraea biroi TaxID=2015173 RepID=A0A026VZ32_OOCBI|nr:hypothetical protein X777_12799 [Ooceraea biroi]